MSYASVNTASADGVLTNRIILSLRKKAYSRIDNVAAVDDQREQNTCKSMFAGNGPASWVSVVMLIMDVTNTLGTATDAEIDTAVNTAWNRIRITG